MTFPSPSLTPPTLTNWQFYYQGLTFGHNTSVKVKNITGLADLATLRSGDVGRPRDHGELAGLDVLGGRDITFTLEAEQSSGSVQNTLQTLSAVTLDGLSTESPLWFQLPNLPLLCVMCRARKRTVPIDIGYLIGNVGLPTVAFHATDPRIYGQGVSTTVAQPTTAGTLTFPRTFPATFGTSGAGGATITNGGNMEMRPLLVITGPCSNPLIGNASIAGNPEIELSNPFQLSGYTIASGDQATVNLDTHSILYYVGGVSTGIPAQRGSWIAYGSTWWTLQPGANLIQFTTTTGNTGATLAVQWAPAYQL